MADDALLGEKIKRQAQGVLGKHGADTSKVHISVRNGQVQVQGKLVRTDGKLNANEISLLAQELSAMPGVRGVIWALS